MQERKIGVDDFRSLPTIAEMTIKADSEYDPFEFGAPLTKCKRYGREKESFDFMHGQFGAQPDGRRRPAS
jgi:hypothetical protein